MKAFSGEMRSHHGEFDRIRLSGAQRRQLKRKKAGLSRPSPKIAM
jgi:hypothetical protein